MKPRFLLDENVSLNVQTQLKRLDSEIVVLTVGDPGAPNKGTKDPEILLWLEANDFILVTENRRTMPEHLARHYEEGHFVPGVLWIRPRTSLGTIWVVAVAVAALIGVAVAGGSGVALGKLTAVAGVIVVGEAAVGLPCRAPPHATSRRHRRGKQIK